MTAIEIYRDLNKVGISGTQRNLGNNNLRELTFWDKKNLPLETKTQKGTELNWEYFSEQNAQRDLAFRSPDHVVTKNGNELIYKGINGSFIVGNNGEVRAMNGTLQELAGIKEINPKLKYAFGKLAKGLLEGLKHI